MYLVSFRYLSIQNGMGTCKNQKNYSIARKESYQTACDVYVKMTSFTNVKMILFKSNIQILDNVFGRHLDPDSASLLATNPIKRESLFLHIQSMKRVNTPQRSSIKFLCVCVQNLFIWISDRGKLQVVRH